MKADKLSFPAIPLLRPALSEAEVQAVARVIRSGWVTQGPEVRKFEEQFASYVGSQHAVAVSNCTAALHLSLVGLDIGPGDEVITVSHSFIATANAIKTCGATPVFVDVHLATMNIDPDCIEAAITSKTKAILCVHQLGMPCDLPRILAIAESRGLHVIEDAACAVGSTISIDGKWQRIGKPHGKIACFSFHPRKLLITGDGGMITTNDDELAARLRRLRQHGMSINDLVRHEAMNVTFEEYVEVGFNYRLTDIQAAMGCVQLATLDERVKTRRELAARYHSLLREADVATPPFEPDWANSNWQSYCALLPQGASQRKVMQYLLDHGIATRRGVMCSHLEPAYSSSAYGGSLVRSEEAQNRGIILPLFESLEEGDQLRVVDELGHALSA